MSSLKLLKRKQPGFTIVELLIVISIIVLLATITVVGYGSWKRSTLVAALKSDLNGVVAAMEDYRTFNNGYPTSSIPSSFTPSEGVLISLSPGGTASSYCVDAVSEENVDLVYYVASETKDQGAIEGTCATRPSQVIPTVPADLTIASLTSTTVSLSWGASSNSPLSYTAQCASDAAFIIGLRESTQSNITTVVTGLDGSSTYYCRVRANNGAGSSAWSSYVSGNTSQYACSDTGQYGTYPACYDYDALPIASSIEGYWTSAPDGYLLEDGSAVSRSTYADLFAVIGSTFGNGDGSTTFNLPDSRGRVSVNRSTTDTEFDVIGEKPGSKTEQLTIAQIPSHTHQVPWTSNGDPSDYLGGSAAAYGMVQTWAGRSGSYNLLEPVGGNGTHNNIQPSIVKTFAIKYRPSTGSGSTLPAGTSIQGYWSTAPNEYLLEDGSAVSRSTYADLFAVTGTAHGVGNGSTTFNLPDSRGRASVNRSPTDTEFDVIGEKPGSKTEQLTIAQIPSHTHQVPWMSSGDPSDYLGGSSAPYGITATWAQRQGSYDMLEPVGGGGTHNNIQPSIVKTFAIKYTAASGSVAASSTGTSIQGYWSTAPSGYLLEDGSAVSRTTYASLFALIGTTHGAGNGSSTFNLPDSRGRVGVNRSSSDSEFNTMGEKYGEKAHILTIAEIPSHTHQVPYLASGDVSDYLGGSAATYGLTSWVGRSGSYDLLEPVGGGGSHNEIQPSIVKVFAIKY